MSSFLTFQVRRFMSPRSFSRSLGIHRLLALVCLVVVCCCASSAQASCGDYLAHPDGSHEMADERDPLAPAAPCRGPSCRQAPQTPPLPAPQRVVVMPTRDALCLSAPHCYCEQNAAWFVVGDEPLHDSFFGYRLFRPPRLAV